MRPLKLGLLPVRLVFGTTRLGFSVGYRTGRLFGYRRLATLAVGVGIGLLVAPVPGRQLRAALRRRIESSRAGSGPELGERVRFELAHHPRTWHLPQPAVEVEQRRVILRGEVPDAAARQEMVRAAAALAGVSEVDDRLVVAGTSPAL